MSSGGRLRWKLALRAGVPFGLLMTGYDLVQGESLALASLRGLLAGIFLGAVMGFFDADHRKREDAVMTASAGRSLSESEFKLVDRATKRGPMPEVEVLHDAALALAEDRRKRLDALKSVIYTFYGLFVLLAAVLAITESPWFWLGAAVVAGEFVRSVRFERRARERLDHLRVIARTSGGGSLQGE